MRRPVYFIAAITLALLAVALQLAAMYETRIGVLAVAQAATLAEHQHAAFQADADEHLRWGTRLSGIGFVVAIASVASNCVSGRKKEPVSRGVAVMLLVVYGMLLIVLV